MRRITSVLALSQPREVNRVVRTPLVSLRNVSKTFTASRPALSAVDLDLFSGEIHGLLGQNGSGKSTLIKILAGYHAPDDGAELRMRGELIDLPLAPGDFRTLGMSFVHQNLGLVETMTVLDNLRVGRYVAGPGWRISWRRERELARRALRMFGVDLALDALVADLPQSHRAVLAIARALQETRGHQNGVLILDEPTPYLGRDAAEAMFDAVRAAAASGAGVLFVSHRLEEVFEITDRVSVLRDGVVIGSASTSEVSQEELITMIVGRRLQDLYPARAEPTERRLLSVRGLAGAGVKEFSVDLFAGEIIGLTGLVGAGFENVPYLLFGAVETSGGELVTEAGTLRLNSLRLRDRLRLGMALVPANRERDGAALSLTIAENVNLPRLAKYFRWLYLDSRRERAETYELMRLFDVRPPNPERVFGTLSGGNQQKAILGKWLVTKPKILILHEPTQGVDIGARRELFKQIRDATDQGACALIASIEYEDLAHLCDRVFVFSDGRVNAELVPPNLSKERIVQQCYTTSSGVAAEGRARAPVET